MGAFLWEDAPTFSSLFWAELVPSSFWLLVHFFNTYNMLPSLFASMFLSSTECHSSNRNNADSLLVPSTEPGTLEEINKHINNKAGVVSSAIPISKEYNGYCDDAFKCPS